MLMAVCAMLLALGPVAAQEYVPDKPMWNPLGHDRPETGGFFTAAEFLFLTQTRPINPQLIATRGFVVTGFSSDVIPGSGGVIDTAGTRPDVVDINGNIILPIQAGTYVGSGTPALFADDLGRTNFQPGWGITFGYRLANGVVIAATYKHLVQTKYSAGATFVPQGFQGPSNLADTFLTSPVSNFSTAYSGPDFQDPLGPDNARDTTLARFEADATGVTPNADNGYLNSNNTYGLWNAASNMQIQLSQRYNQFDLIARVPVYENDFSRSYFLAGGRFSWFWERFKWRTEKDGFNEQSFRELAQTALRLNGLTGPIVLQQQRIPVLISAFSPADGAADSATNTQYQIEFFRTRRDVVRLIDTATYSNTVSNRLYGPVVGYGCEYYMGRNFAVSADVTGSIMLDVVKTIAKYEKNNYNSAVFNAASGLQRANQASAQTSFQVLTQARSAKTFYEAVPHFGANINLWWYPIDGVQMTAGYQALGFFNTLAAKDPVDFNFGGLDPRYDHQSLRLLHGLNVGIGFIF
jgi:hypothetical protein